jgi:hypothetical protein
MVDYLKGKHAEILEAAQEGRPVDAEQAQQLLADINNARRDSLQRFQALAKKVNP